MKNVIINVLVAASFVLGLAAPMGVLAAGPAAVNLGLAGNFVILSKSGISTTGSTSIIGDIGVSPITSSAITGFALTLPAAGAFSTSALVTGNVYAPDYAVPTPTTMTTAVSDMQTAYTDAMGRASTVTELGAGNIGGLTLVPGVYKWGTGVTIPTNVTLSGGANDVWIFQIAQNLDISSAAHVILSGGARAGNVFWVVAGQTTLGTTSAFSGNILDQTAIVLNTGATLNGRALAQTAVTLDANNIIVPALVYMTPEPTTPVTPAVPMVNYTTPVTPTTPAVTQNTVLSGCSGGSMYNTSTGQLCVNNTMTTSVDAGCLPGNTFSITTGRNCMAATPNASFNRNLTVGTTGADVKTLQVWLNTHGYVVASSGPGSSGNETMTFGGLTRAALAKFQAQVGISPAAGYFGAITRAYLATH